MIQIDGSEGEGGGQILRTSLALSLVTGEPVRLERIRAGRKKPGLMRQHLTCVLSAAEIGSAKVRGAELGSLELEFQPGKVRAGSYRFAIGTAGSTSLVLQTVLPALLAAGGTSEIELEGERVTEVATAFGEKSLRAHAVADQAIDELQAYLASNAPVGVHLADQLLIPLALAGGGSLLTVTPSLHTRTNAEIVQRFLPVAIAIEAVGKHAARIDARARE